MVVHSFQDCDGAILKVYQSWVLEVSLYQHSLGSFIIFSRHTDARRQTDLLESEEAELRLVMQDMDCALKRHDAFRADAVDYAQIGSLPIVPFHGIPRYKKPRQFFGREWKDVSWGTLPHWTTEKAPIDLIDALCRELKPQLAI